MRNIGFLAIIISTGFFTSCTDSSDEILNDPQQIKVKEMNIGGGLGGNDHDPDPEPVAPKEDDQIGS